MDALRISLLLLLPCFSCFLDGEVTLVKTIGKEPYFTSICTNETSNIIVLIVCNIRTERSSGEECRLLYKDEGEFINECDSRFTLTTRNQTVFLHLTSLTPADSGNYSCDCSKAEGMNILHLSVTVNITESFPDDNPADEFWSHSAGVILPSALTAAVLFIIIVSVIVGFICRRHPDRARLGPETSGSSVNGSAATVDEDDSHELHKSYQQPTSNLYQNVHQKHETEINKVYVNLENLQVNRNYEIYENI
ncbi:uncharacterized protein LOC105922616 [Fundulus heteroclitus]|uniref:uncharacterized protein LOC105922616 n=1 Tax=Fundulus heteroclitus TaxID=8078 RepID=UPI00165A490D|nr:uncharacterized protein LOC105922616 [Fundulus heteroclitus]